MASENVSLYLAVQSTRNAIRRGEGAHRAAQAAAVLYGGDWRQIAELALAAERECRQARIRVLVETETLKKVEEAI